MNSRIICYTLFNITYTGITSRTKPNTEEIKDWTVKRNTQWNFDTILQLISLRSQPDILTYPEKIKSKNLFGTIFQKQDKIYCWKFIFQVQHNSVFDNEEIKLGNLYNDCHNVPMILVGGENNLLMPILDTSPQQRNIFFDYE
jgi:hypothetical protein